MDNHITYVLFAYLFTFTLLFLLGIKSYSAYLNRRKILNNIDKDLNNRK